MKRLLPLLAVLLLIGGGSAVILFTQSSVPAPKNVIQTASISKDRIQGLEHLNLTNSKTYLSVKDYDKIMNPEVVKAYHEKYQRDWMSQRAVDLFCKQNDLLFANVDSYVGEIPVEWVNTIVILRERIINEEWIPYGQEQERVRKAEEEAYKKAHPKEKIDGTLYTDGDGEIVGSRHFYFESHWRPIGGDPNPDHQLYIIAQKELIKIEEGDKVVNNVVIRDPLLLMKVPNGGYVVLAKW